MTQLERKLFGYNPKWKLTFINRTNSKEKKIIFCHSWFCEAHKGDIFAVLSKGESSKCIEDDNYYLDEAKELY